MSAKGIEDRRISRRADIPSGQAFCSNDQHMGYYDVKDLSTGGAFLSSGKMHPIGTSLDLVLSAPGLGVVEITCEVVRQDRARQGIGIQFHTLDPFTHARVGQVVSAHLSRCSDIGPDALSSL